MERLRALVGIERSVAGVSQALHFAVSADKPAVVRAMHITCADEAEHECAQAFQQGFVQYVVPPLKFAERSAFRIANLGGRYEWGAIRIAEEHYATTDSQRSGKLLVIKVNAHVGIHEDANGHRFGVMKRYEMDSPCCSALHALLQGGHQPYIEHLREDFSSEGMNRVAALLDVDPAKRSLYAAIISARLQARKVTLDIQDHRPASPTRYLVVPCVTINRPQRDTEIVCGFYSANDPGRPDLVEYFGLGDEAQAYQLQHKNSRFAVSDEQIGTARQARDHRQEVLRHWHARSDQRRDQVEDDRLHRVWNDVAQSKHRNHDHAKALLRVLLPVLAEVNPVSAAVLLFANGMAGIHHGFRMHRMVREMEDSGEAKKILDEIHEKVDHLDQAHAEAMIELLMKQYRR